MKEKSHGGRPAANWKVNPGVTRWRNPQPTCNQREENPAEDGRELTEEDEAINAKRDDRKMRNQTEDRQGTPEGVTMKRRGSMTPGKEGHDLQKGSNGQRTPRDEVAREEGGRTEEEEGPRAVHTQRTKRQRE